jgi:hypothetical protein
MYDGQRIIDVRSGVITAGRGHCAGGSDPRSSGRGAEGRGCRGSAARGAGGGSGYWPRTKNVRMEHRPKKIGE